MRVMICSDEADPTVGHFVESCASLTLEFMQDLDLEIDSINSVDLTEVNINEIANRYGNQSFICAAYSHGSELSLICSESGDYISDKVNFNSFENTLFYTWACSSAHSLGQILVNNGCLSFVGYVEPVHIPAPGDVTFDIFVECATYALRVFYEENISIGDAINAMRDLFDEKEMELIDSGNGVAAAYLLDHNNALDLIGSEGLVRSDIFQD